MAAKKKESEAAKRSIGATGEKSSVKIGKESRSGKISYNEGQAQLLEAGARELDDVAQYGSESGRARAAKSAVRKRTQAAAWRHKDKKK